MFTWPWRNVSHTGIVTTDAAKAHRHQVTRRSRSTPAISAANQVVAARATRLSAVQRISRHSADIGSNRAKKIGPIGG